MPLSDDIGLLAARLPAAALELLVTSGEASTAELLKLHDVNHATAERLLRKNRVNIEALLRRHCRVLLADQDISVDSPQTFDHLWGDLQGWNNPLVPAMRAALHMLVSGSR